MNNMKTTKVFSGPLMKQTFKSNLILSIVILLIMVLMSTVINYAMSIMGGDDESTISEDTQEDLFTYLFVIESYDQTTKADLSYDDFVKSSDKSEYKQAFNMYNASLKDDEDELSVKGFENIVKKVDDSSVKSKVYVREFEYVYALSGTKGCFTGEELDMSDMMDTMFEAMGISTDTMDAMSDMDMTSTINSMYFTVMGLLPIFLLIVIVGNGVIAGQVDRGSMAYILATPTRRSAVTVTQAIYMVVVPLVIIAVVCAARIATSNMLFGEPNVEMNLMLYLGMYILVEAVAGICYFASCCFNESRKAMALGGGLAVWFFLASLLGMFGSDDMVDMGIGAEVLGVFNKLTIVSLYDVDALGTVGSGDVDMTFLPKLIILAVIAIVFYIAGAIRFNRKDLPL